MQSPRKSLERPWDQWDNLRARLYFPVNYRFKSRWYNTFTLQCWASWKAGGKLWLLHSNIIITQYIAGESQASTAVCPPLKKRKIPFGYNAWTCFTLESEFYTEDFHHLQYWLYIDTCQWVGYIILEIFVLELMRDFESSYESNQCSLHLWFLAVTAWPLGGLWLAKLWCNLLNILFIVY